ncbi:acyl-CoA dehydrogenase family protein [Mycobacterium sp. Root135]|uniref:acyl-CoA dehydrogenase family protein n=1 Tax=Mycobacterium sp. Root135 TaxID=1736457 RepID=UPI00210169D2|nr:acyl-CoA dehydrogenase family protein [Mycobacterium sp. Root135]
MGGAQRAFDDALAYVGQRHQFGTLIGSFQALSHRLADLATELEATRLLASDVVQRVEKTPGSCCCKPRRWSSSRQPNWPS